MTGLALRLSTQSSESSMISAEPTDVSGSFPRGPADRRCWPRIALADQ